MFLIAVPDPPTGVKVTDSRQDSLQLEWNPIPGKFISYCVEMKPSNSDEWVPVNTLPTRDNSMMSKPTLLSKKDWKINSFNYFS